MRSDRACARNRTKSASDAKPPADAGDWAATETGFDDYGGDYAGYDGAYADYDDGAYDDGAYDGGEYGDGAGDVWPGERPDNPRGMPQPRLPERRKKRRASSEGSGRKQRRVTKSKGTTAGGTLTWVGAGLIAGVVSLAITVALGFTGISFLIILSAFLTAGMIGGVIRVTAGSTDGWGPGLVAVAIAVPAIFVGRVGAYYVDPDIAAAFAEDERTPEDIRKQIDSQTSTDGMIAQLVEDELYYDDAWLRQNGITEDNFWSDVWNDEEDATEFDLPWADQYHPTVWAEGQRRWNELSSAEQQARSEERRLQRLLDEGMMDDESLGRLLALRTTETAMIAALAYEVGEDANWMTAAGITDAQLQEHYEQNYQAASAEQRLHPRIREEASKRWAELSEDDRAARRSVIEQELRDEIRSVGEFQELSGHFRLGAAVVWAIISLFMPFRPIAVTLASVFLAFKLGSGLASG